MDTEIEQAPEPKRATIDREELERRLVYALFRPAVRAALDLETPLAWMKQAMETAYFHEARRQGMSLREISQALDISISKTALLSRQLKDNFQNPARAPDLARRIEYMLWAGPLTLARLNQVLTEERFQDIEAALDELIEQGRIVRHGEGSFASHELEVRAGERLWDFWLARLDALDEAMAPVADASQHAMLFDEDDSPPSPGAARAHTHTLRLRREDVGRLEQLYHDQWRAGLDALAARAQKAPDEEVVEVRLATFWAGPPSPEGASSEEE